MNYSIVIATRNRVDALKLSIPRMLGQSSPPSQLLVVDSSDNHQEVCRLVECLTKGSTVNVKVIEAERGLTRQRNIGLDLVNQPIVFFPDDDSIWFPGVAQAIMSVYENDVAGEISAVCAYESRKPPLNFEVRAAGYAMSRASRLKRPFLRFRAKIENWLFPDPFRVLGKQYIASLSAPGWWKDAKVKPVEWMTGFRMTFRTEIIRKVKFDENLTRYSLNEDIDASFGAWRHGAVVATPGAQVYHYRSPERRDDGWRMGVTSLLNLGYIVAKHTPIMHPSRLCLSRFARFKTFLYLMAAKDGFGKERYLGARVALSRIPLLTTIESRLAAANYHAAMAECLAKDRS
jgi:glycosyltransferase involved in cell wall biosynthesis